MPKIEIHPVPIATWLTVLAIGGAGLTACGSSSETVSTPAGAPPATGSTAKTTSTAPAKTASARAKTAAKQLAGGKANAKGTPRPRASTPTTAAPARNAFANALSRFTDCLRRNGVAIPTQGTKASNPLLSLKGVKTNTPQFRAATTKCRRELIAALRQPKQPSAG
jgi:hypothetical protein